MNGGRGHGRVADRNTQLVEIRYDVASRIQSFDACLLMFINLQAADVVALLLASGPFGTNGATESRIKDVDLAHSRHWHLRARCLFERNAPIACEYLDAGCQQGAR